MGKRLHVSNLALNIDSAQLEAIFSPIGRVKNARVVVNQYNGASRGFGYVEMSSADDASTCIEKLNGQELDGRALTVVEAKPLPPKAKRA